MTKETKAGILANGTAVEINSSIREIAPEMVGLRAVVMRNYKNRRKPRVMVAFSEDNPYYPIGAQFGLPIEFVIPVEKEG